MCSVTEWHLQVTISPNINGVEVGDREERITVCRYMQLTKIMRGDRGA